MPPRDVAELLGDRPRYFYGRLEVPAILLTPFRRSVAHHRTEGGALRVPADERLGEHRETRAVGRGTFGPLVDQRHRSRGIERCGPGLHDRHFTLLIQFLSWLANGVTPAPRTVRRTSGPCPGHS